VDHVAPTLTPPVGHVVLQVSPVRHNVVAESVLVVKVVPLKVRLDEVARAPAAFP
jgi:hypothetical protein